MVLFSGDLNIIQDAIRQISDKVSRDFVELEMLQNSYNGTTNFANKTVEFIKNKLFNYLNFKKPNYDIVFLGDKTDESQLKSNFRYLISPLCGKINLIHAIPYFSTSIALLKKDKDGSFKTICGVIDNTITQETFVVETGKGAYLNSRRIRVSGRTELKDSLIAIKNVENKDFILNTLKKFPNVMVTNCEVLNICNVASGKYDLTFLDKKAEYQDLSLLLVKEAGGIVKELESGEIFVGCNNLF